MSGELSIGVVGGGVAGIVAAHLLSRQHQVTIFEQDSWLGGHTNTITIPSGPDAGLAVDTGFIVMNDATYPLLHRFLEVLGVKWRYADMSFSVCSDESGLQYTSAGFKGLFADRKNFLSPPFWRFLAGIPKFWSAAERALSSASLDSMTLRDFIARENISPLVVSNFLVPLAGAVWSSPAQGIDDFPARTFLQFFKNHGWLSYFGQPRWQTVVGGSFEYVKAFQRQYKGRIALNTPVRGVQRDGTKVKVVLRNGSYESFDRVVIAAHADQALKLLETPSALERELLGPWSYHVNRTLLHTDDSFLPPLRRAWASWNYRQERSETGRSPVSVTYWMNHLQGFSARQNYCVTLNPRRPVREGALIAEFNYTHPAFTRDAVRAQAQLPQLNKQGDIYFCGSYFGYGFHEDAVRSSVKLGEEFGLSL